jgi:hypothetical protein
MSKARELIEKKLRSGTRGRVKESYGFELPESFNEFISMLDALYDENKWAMTSHAISPHLSSSEEKKLLSWVAKFEKLMKEGFKLPKNIQYLPLTIDLGVDL